MLQTKSLPTYRSNLAALGRAGAAWPVRSGLYCGLAAWMSLASARAGTVTWDANPGTPGAQDGSGTWSSTAANWWDGSADNGWVNGDNAIFGTGTAAAGGVTITNSGITVGSITFNLPGSGNYNISASTNILTLTLTGKPVITATAGSSNNITTPLAGVGFTKEGTGTVLINPSANNTFTGLTVINTGTIYTGTSDSTTYISSDLQVNPSGVFNYSSAQPFPLTATLTVNGGTVVNLNAKNLYFNKLVLDNGGVLRDVLGTSYLIPTNVDARSGLIGTGRYRSPASGSINLVKSSAGTVVVTNRPNTQGTDLYRVTANAGTLIFDKTTHTSRRVGPTVLLAGGTLVFSNSVGTATTEQSISNTIVLPGGSSVVDINTGTANGAVALAGIARSTGGTLNVSAAGASTAATYITMTNPLVNGIEGGWMTINQSDWVQTNASFILAPYSAYQTSADSTTWLATDNVSLAGNPLAALSTLTINSLKLSAASTVALADSAQTLTLSSGGLLVTGSGATAITGGTLRGSAGGDLVVIQNSSADLSISSTLADNTSATALTKSGNGKLILSGANNMTGANYLNGGTVEVSDLAQMAGGALVLNNGTLSYTGTDASSTRAVTLNGLGGTISVPTGVTLTQSGAINGSGAALGDFGGLTKTGDGTLVLTASNSFNGPTLVSTGTLVVNGTNNCNAAVWNSGTVTVLTSATLGGSGVIGGPAELRPAATLAPGGTLGFGTNLVLDPGSVTVFDLTNSPGTGDVVAVNGDLGVTNAHVQINVAGTPLAVGSYTLFTYTGKLLGSFWPTVTVAGGSIDGTPSIDTSTPGVVKLVLAPQVAISTEPADTIVSVGQDATLTVAATGSSPITYEWYSFGNDTNSVPSPIGYGTSASVTITNAQSTDSGYYEVVVANGFNSVTSRITTLIVGNVAPVIAGPVSQTVIQGNNATFNTVVLIANPAPSLQWRTNDVDVPGATGSSFTLTAVPFALDGTVVSVVASNIAGLATNSAVLSVIVPPVITPQPVSLTVNAGDPASFNSGATGVPAPSLQWFRNGVALSDQTAATLNIGSAQGSDIGTYTLVASNAAGVATSTGAKLVVNSTTLAASSFIPANGATGINLDTPLTVTFNNTVGTVNAGKLRIWNTASPLTPVDTIDMSSNVVVVNGAVGVYNVQNRVIGGATYRAFPVLLTGPNTALVYPHSGVLAAGQTYYVTVDNGVFADATGAYFAGITNAGDWQFTTKSSPLTAGSTNIVVAADGSGDFNTVQGAIDFIAPGNTNHTLVTIRNGTYREINYLNAKHNITFRGQDRHQTVITYVNNDPLNGGTSGRPMFRIASANDIALENLTLTNATPKGGQQAEALRVGDGSKRFIGYNADFDSYQDTILVNNSGDIAYFQDCHVQGDTDFIWGLGTMYFTNCEIMCMSSQSYVTQARTDATTNGIAFINCQIVRGSAAVGTNSCYLGRDPGNGYPYCQAVFVSCSMDNHIAPVGWFDGGETVKSSLRFWEYQSTDLTGTNLVDVSQRASWSTQISYTTATNVMDVNFWLYGWTPKLAPNVLVAPSNLSVAGGATATFTVSATGIPAPSYQWLRSGTNLSGANAASLVIAPAYVPDAGNYAVIVSNGSGSVTTADATLTVGNSAPSLAAVADTNINAGVTLNFALQGSDPDQPVQTLSYVLMSGPAGATVDGSTGVFNWRPAVTQADSANLITVQVLDNGTPVLGASQSFTVNVNPLTQPLMSAPAVVGGQMTATVTGQVGPDYAIEASGDLVHWTTILITNSPPSPFEWTDTNAPAAAQFYRIKMGPPLP